MIRPILPILAYMSVLSSTYSLHMARDAYIKPPPPPPPAQLLDELDDMSELLAENGVDLMRPLMGTVHQKTHAGTGTGGGGGGGGSGSIISIGSSSNGAVALGTINHVASNELPELSPPPAHLPAAMRHGPIGPLVGQPPRGLQELFGVQTNFDIRAAQQQLSHGGPNGVAASFDLNQSASASGMDDRDDDNRVGGGGGGGDDINGTGAGGGGGGGQGNGNLQRSAASSKRASPTGSRNKMMADSGQDGGGGSSSGLPSIPHGIANQMMLRSTRGQRQYDVPQIECPPAMDGMERFACPTPDRQGRYRCIDDHVLCDGFIDCPEGEDEDRQACMFYKTTKAHLDVLADALLRWARGR